MLGAAGKLGDTGVGRSPKLWDEKGETQRVKEVALGVEVLGGGGWNPWQAQSRLKGGKDSGLDPGDGGGGEGACSTGNSNCTL